MLEAFGTMFSLFGSILLPHLFIRIREDGGSDGDSAWLPQVSLAVIRNVIQVKG